MRGLACAAVLLSCCAAAVAQPREEPRGEPPRASLCDRLAGAERSRCIAEEQAQRERLGRREREMPRDCDRLFGPEKEACLKRGGTVRASGTDRR